MRTHRHDWRATGEVRRGMLTRIVARIVSPAVIGLETATVEVEVDLRPGLPGFSVVGLPDAAVQEARERVRSGVVNQAFALPPIRIIANLAPLDSGVQLPAALQPSGECPVGDAGGGRGNLQCAARGEVGDDLRAHLVGQLRGRAGPAWLAHAATLAVAPSATDSQRARITSRSTNTVGTSSQPSSRAARRRMLSATRGR